MEPLKAALADRYQIDREIGRGGMATVYLARDIKHDRRVALKVLNAELGAVLGVERFLGEIRVTANLQHPNLLPLFDSGEVNGLLFYVMPFVEGETLRHRLEHEKQLPVDEAVRIASAVAGALDYAHRHGVVHRDLKPENILLHDGQPLVADFGIALAVSNAGGARITQTGLSLGTPQYMSPEQATGDRAIDARTDIYSLGAIAYEMLAGEPPHTGTSAQAIIARLMTEEPRPLTIVRRSVPAHVDDAVQRALEKLPADRFATAKEFAEAIGGATIAGTAVRHAPARPGGITTSRSAFWSVASAAVLATGALVWSLTRATAVLLPVVVRIDDDPRSRVLRGRDGGRMVAVSADGRSITYISGGDSGRTVITRRVDEIQGRPMQGVADLSASSEMSYSPDGRWLAMGIGDRKVLVSTKDGQSRNAVCGLRSNGLGATTFAPNNDLIYDKAGSIWRLTPGGTPSLLTTPDSSKREATLIRPMMLPDGTNLVFTVRLADGGIRVGSVTADGKSRHTYDLAIANAIGYVDGWLIYGARPGTVNAVRFDPRSGTRGEPVVLVEGVRWASAEYADASLSPAGTLVYVRGQSRNTVAILDATGAEQHRLEQKGAYESPTWSPDGTKIAYGFLPWAGLPGNRPAIYVYALASSAPVRLTSQRDAGRPAWTPDGSRVGFIDTRTSDIWWTSADGTGAEELLYRPPVGQAREVVFTGEGRSAVFRYDSDNDSAGGACATLRRDLHIVPVGGGPAKALVTSPFTTSQPAISPDGRLIAYSSNETGRYEVYVRAVSGGTRLLVSDKGAMEPRWASSSQLIYRSVNSPGAFWRANIAAAGSPMAVTRRELLFADPSGGNPNTRPNYDVSRDGRFVVVREADDAPAVIAIVNWLTDVRAKLKGK